MEKEIKELIRDLDHKDEDVRWGAAFVLARIGEPAVNPLIAALGDRESTVRLRAAWALGAIGDERAIEPLILALKDGDWAVRVRVADALGKIKPAKALEPLIASLQGREFRCAKTCDNRTQEARGSPGGGTDQPDPEGQGLEGQDGRGNGPRIDRGSEDRGASRHREERRE